VYVIFQFLGNRYTRHFGGRVRAGGWLHPEFLLFQLDHFDQKAQNVISFQTEAKEFSIILVFQKNGPTPKHPFQ